MKMEMKMRTKMFVLPMVVLIFIALSGCASAWGWWYSSQERDPVLLVHGWGMKCWNTWGVMKYRLKKAGYDVYCIDFSNNIGSNVRNARELSQKVDEILKRTGKSKVDLVVHSMGGLSARYYIKNLGGASKVRDVVELGSPNHGTYLAYTAFGFSKGAREMLPGSKFLRELNSGDETPGKVKWTSIWSICDEAMYPKKSPILDGARNRKVWWCVGHLGLTVDYFVYKWVKQGLNGGGCNNN
jgi:triacylglycerol lipase